MMAPAVLLLHGGAGPDSVAGFANLLADRTGSRVITPVHPGFGGTSRPEALATIGGLAEAYIALLDALDIDDVTVIGNSIGGWTAAEIAVGRPSRLGRLALVDAVGIDVPGHRVVDFFVLTPRQIAERSFHDPARSVVPDVATLPPSVRAITEGNREALRVYGDPMTEPGLLERLASIDVPTTVIWGESDGIADVDYGRAYADAIPRAQFIVLEGAGHVPQIETPETLLGALTPVLG
ncbi:alpha/beta hydrolase [Gordonia sp. VNQ95]|jgi:pimeloyl-ACP methyl ester carboxylesterase|uniref:alpha/beta fold hydrolase n=1 Tax=Gordonia TaxID=2053 RepID=UPI0032B5E416